MSRVDERTPRRDRHLVVWLPNGEGFPKTANCQTLVSLTLARDEVPVVLALRLFLPGASTAPS
jgi:hypothetical protein